MGLKGGPELRARLKAIGQAFKPLGRDWADDTVDRLARATPRRTGATARSYRRRNSSAKRATVVGSHVAYFIDAGQREHAEAPRRTHALRFEGRAGIKFSKRVQHPRVAPRPFRARAATEALNENSPLKAVVKEWNEAAR